MTVASCLPLSALSGRVNLACTRRSGRLHLGREPVRERHRCRNGCVCKRTVSCKMQVDEAVSLVTKLVTPRIEKALDAVSFHCWDRDLALKLAPHQYNAGMSRCGLPKSLSENLTPQEKVELLSVAFIDDMVRAVTERTGLNSIQTCTQHSVQDALSLATAVAAVQQVPNNGYGHADMPRVSTKHSQ